MKSHRFRKIILTAVWRTEWRWYRVKSGTGGKWLGHLCSWDTMVATKVEIASEITRRELLLNFVQLPFNLMLNLLHKSLPGCYVLLLLNTFQRCSKIKVYVDYYNGAINYPTGFRLPGFESTVPCIIMGKFLNPSMPLFSHW